MIRHFELREASNGGWILTKPNGPGFIPENISAYSSTTDMLKGLQELLLPVPTSEMTAYDRACQALPINHPLRTATKDVDA